MPFTHVQYSSLAGLMVLGLATPAMAQHTEYAQVISSVPMYQQVATPQQVCSQDYVNTPAPRSGAGAAVGAIAGGAIGNSIGHGNGRAVATMLGLVGGALIGDRIEGGGGHQTQPVTQCATQYVYENRLTGYQVTYQYAGRQYQVQLPQDPGPTMPISLTPAVPPSVQPAQPHYPPPNPYGAPGGYAPPRDWGYRY